MKTPKRNPFEKLINNQDRRLSVQPAISNNHQCINRNIDLHPLQKENEAVGEGGTIRGEVDALIKVAVRNQEEQSRLSCDDFVIESPFLSERDNDESVTMISPLSLSSSSTSSSSPPPPPPPPLCEDTTCPFVSPPPITIPNNDLMSSSNGAVDTEKVQELTSLLKQREEELQRLQSDIRYLKGMIREETTHGFGEGGRSISDLNNSFDFNNQVDDWVEPKLVRSPMRSPMRPRKSRYSLENMMVPPLLLESSQSLKHQLSDESCGEGSSSIGGNSGKSSRASFRIRQSLDTGGRRVSLLEHKLSIEDEKFKFTNINEILCIGVSKEYLSGDNSDYYFNAKSTAESMVSGGGGQWHMPPAEVLEKWTPGQSNTPSTSISIADECEVPLIQECCFPLGVPLSLVTPFEAKQLLVSSPKHSTHHVMQFPAPKDPHSSSEMFYSVSLISLKVVSNPRLDLIKKLKKQVRESLAAVIILDFITRVGGCSAFAAYRFKVMLSRQESAELYTPSSLWSSRKKHPSSEVATPSSRNYANNTATPAPNSSTATPSSLSGYFKLAENALMKWQETSVTTPLQAPPLQANIDTSTASAETTSYETPKEKKDGKFSKHSKSGEGVKLPTKAVSAEYRRRCRAILNGPVVLITQEACCILTRLQSHEVFIRILHSMHEKMTEEITKKHIIMEALESSSNIGSKKSRKSFFKSLNQLRSEKKALKLAKLVQQSFEGKIEKEEYGIERKVGKDIGQEDSNLILDEDDYFTDSDHDYDDADSDTEEEGGVAKEVLPLNQNKSKPSRKFEIFHSLFEQIACDTSLKDTCGAWCFKFPPLGIEIREVVSYASLEEWSLAVLFSVVPIKSIVRMIHLMLCESKIVVSGSDAGLVSIIAATLPRLITPLSWECVHIPVKPISLTAEDLVDCPTPFIVGIVQSQQETTPSFDLCHYSDIQSEVGCDDSEEKKLDYVRWLLHRYHPVQKKTNHEYGSDCMPSDVSMLDLDCAEARNMLKEAVDFQHVFGLHWNNSNGNSSSEKSSMLSNQLCNDLLKSLQGSTSSDNDENEEDEEDEDEEEEEDDEFIDGFCHNKEFLEQQCNEVNDTSERCFGPISQREALAHLASSYESSLASNKTEQGHARSQQNRMKLASKVAQLYSCGLTPEEVSKISDVRHVLNKFISSLCEDVGSNWNKYGEEHPQQGFEFIPRLFLGPRSEKLAIQTELVHSQMFHYFVSRHRQEEQDRTKLVMKHF